jgi:haloalkane dehalogenase
MVGHDWGGALAFDWAARHPERVLGLTFLESIVKAMDWGELSPQARKRSEAHTNSWHPRGDGARARSVHPPGVHRRCAYPMSDGDLAEYLAPYPSPESRRPILERLTTDGHRRVLAVLVYLRR